jgi:hypothetical protein
MKNYIFVSILLSIVTLSSFKCKKETDITDPSCFKGRLEIKGLCMNYTIKLLEGNIPSDAIESSWIDPSTGKEYNNVFRLENHCDFPSTIKEGDEFYFIIEKKPSNDCVRCLAYYPTPSKDISIRVINERCIGKNN